MSLDTEKDQFGLPTTTKGAGKNALQSTNTMENIKAILSQHFPDKLPSLLKADEKNKKTTQENQEETTDTFKTLKEIAQYFQATFIAETPQIKNLFHIKTPLGAFLVTHDKKIILGPVLFLKTYPNSGYTTYSNTISGSYIDQDNIRYLYCIATDLSLMVLTKKDHYNTLRPTTSKDIYILGVDIQSDNPFAEEVSNFKKRGRTKYDYLINEVGEIISSPHEEINHNLIASRIIYDSDDPYHCGITQYRLLQKGNGYYNHTKRYHFINHCENNKYVFIDEDTIILADSNGSHICELIPVSGYEKDTNNTLLYGKNKNSTGYSIIYDGEIYNLPSNIIEIYSSYTISDIAFIGDDNSYNSVFLKDQNNKLFYRKEGEILAPNIKIEGIAGEAIFYNQAFLYRSTHDQSILVDSNNTIVGIGNYRSPSPDLEGLGELHNYYCVQEISHEKYSTSGRIIGNTGAVSEIYDKICDQDEKDKQIIKNFGYIKVQKAEKYTLVDPKTGKELLEGAHEISCFLEEYILVKRVLSPAPNYQRECFLFNKDLQPVLGPVENIKQYGNLIRVEPYESGEITTHHKKNLLPPDYAIYYFHDLTPVGK